MWNPIEKGEPIDPTKPVPLTSEAMAKEISALACSMAKKRGIPKARCGRRWIDGFLRRNQDLLGQVVSQSDASDDDQSD